MSFSVETAIGAFFAIALVFLVVVVVPMVGLLGIDLWGDLIRRLRSLH